MRTLMACVALLGVLGACEAPENGTDGAAGPTKGDPANNPNTFRADVDPQRPYAGEWALAANQCGDDKKVWTIETRRMAVAPAMRFCAFDSLYVSNSDGVAQTWSASAKCLAEGRESHDFLFFRVHENLREMRVTFNDTKSFNLVRCPAEKS